MGDVPIGVPDQTAQVHVWERDNLAPINPADAQKQTEQGKTIQAGRHRRSLGAVLLRRFLKRLFDTNVTSQLRMSLRGKWRPSGDKFIEGNLAGLLYG